MTTPLIADLGAPELGILFAVIMLFFGASKLPDLARNTGRALRIFKSETKGLMSRPEDASESEQWSHPEPGEHVRASE